MFGVPRTLMLYQKQIEVEASIDLYNLLLNHELAVLISQNLLFETWILEIYSAPTGKVFQSNAWSLGVLFCSLRVYGKRITYCSLKRITYMLSSEWRSNNKKCLTSYSVRVVIL
jgi:hypothetical protein